MSDHHPLKVLLNIHLASDASAVLHLPFILSTLQSDSFDPSPHLSKWTARIQALLHSKGPGGRWVGLVLAHKTAALSQALLLESAQVWVGVALPLLSKNEPSVVLKAAIRLLRTIFTRSHEISEFRRQVATPNIPKLVSALMPLIEQTGDTELKACSIIMGLTTLESLILLYPALHKAFYGVIVDLALRFLNGRPHAPLPYDIICSASRLYSVVHVTGGKVGTSTLWRKMLDETLAFATNAFWSLRTTFKTLAPTGVLIPPAEDPAISIPLHLNRLKCAITILDDLLSTTIYRPVQIPVGGIVHFALQLTGASDHTKKDGFVDATTHTLEISAIPNVQELGCSLIRTLAERLGRHLQPYLVRIMTIFALHLEQRSTSEHRYILLHTLETLLRHHPSSHSPLVATRLMKATLPSVTMILARPENTSNTRLDGSIQSKSRKGKKKAQMYEGEVLFSVSRPVICPTDVDGKVLLTALEVLRLLLRDPHLSAAIQSISVRVLVSVTLTLSFLPPATLSPDPTLYHGVLAKLQGISTELVAGTSNTLSKGLPLITGALIRATSNVESQRQLDLLLHPRLPPLITAMPLIENLSLVFSEEPQEETELRESLGLDTLQEEMQRDVDTEMADSTKPPILPPLPTSAAPPKTTPSLGYPVTHTAFPKSNGEYLDQMKVATPSGPTPAPTREPVEILPSSPVRSAIIEPPRPQVSKPVPQSFQVENSDSNPKIPVYNIPGPMAADEDEDMPAIDVESDSDVE